MINERLSSVLLTSFLARAVFLFIPLFVTPLVLKNIGIGNYAIIGIFVFVQGAIALLDFGIVPTLVREISFLRAQGSDNGLFHNTLRTIEFIYAGLALCVLLLGGLAGVVAAFFWMNLEAIQPIKAAIIFCVMSLGASASFMNGLYTATMVAMSQQLRLNMLSILISLVGASVSIYGLHVLKWHLLEFVAWQASVSWVGLLITRRIAWRALPPTTTQVIFDKSILLSLRRFAAGMSVTQILAVISMNLDRILLARLLPSSSFGHYALGSTVASSIAGVGHPIISVVTPKLMFAFGSEDKNAAVQQYHFYSQLVSAVIFPVVVVAVIFAEPLFFAWLNDAEIASVASFPFQLLALGWLMNVLMNIPYVAQLAHGWVRLGLFGLLIGLIVQIPVLIYFVPRYGISAGAWSWFLMELGFFLIAIPIMHRYILKGEALEWYFRDVICPGLGALAIGYIFYYIFNFYELHLFAGRIGVFLYIGLAIFSSMIASVILASRLLPAVRNFAAQKLS